MRQLLLSSSRAGDSGYLEPSLAAIGKFTGNIKGTAVFIPFAGVTVSFDTYHQMVTDALKPTGITPAALHQTKDPQALLAEAELVLVGGGNTFALLQRLQSQGLLSLLRQKCTEGTAYIGWSAGSNITAPTICTTNDMPIVQPESFQALGLVPFQINPHYIDGNPPGHNGETRQQRLEEYLTLSPEQTVVALPEGSWLERDNQILTYHGLQQGFIFRHGQPRQAVEPGINLSNLLTTHYDR